jgi:FdhD protein
MKKTALLFITRINGDKRENLPDSVITETPIHLFLNHNQIATIICTPEHIPELAVGYLFTEQTVKDKKDKCLFL